jgi:Uma2 family endonuclease
MAAANASMLVPLEVYLETTYRPDCDWVEGELKERHVGEGEHASVQGYLIEVLRVNGRGWGVRAYPEFRVQTSERHYRVADVCVTLRSTAYEPIARTPPLLCVEVLFKDDRMSEMQAKIEDYLGLGVRTVWVIDPRRRKAFSTDAHGLAVSVEELTVRGTAIRVLLQDVFAELDELGAL